jgi:hypothetical protein
MFLFLYEIAECEKCIGEARSHWEDGMAAVVAASWDEADALLHIECRKNCELSQHSGEALIFATEPEEIQFSISRSSAWVRKETFTLDDDERARLVRLAYHIG